MSPVAGTVLPRECIATFIMAGVGFTLTCASSGNQTELILCNYNRRSKQIPPQYPLRDGVTLMVSMSNNLLDRTRTLMI
jgi:hypothetical protein